MKITIEDKENNIIVTAEKSNINLFEVLELLEHSLKATGFVFKGRLEIVEDE